MSDSDRSTGVYLAEVIAALSLGTDLGLGLPMEHVLRQCVIALGLAECAGLDEGDRAIVYYLALLAWVGCHADSFEQARWFGDDIRARSDIYSQDLVGNNKMRFAMRNVGGGMPPVRRAGTILEFMIAGREAMKSMHSTHCVIAGELARRLGLGEALRDALLQMFERWDGQGGPVRLSGSGISRSVRIVQLADVVEVYHRAGGVAAAVEVARDRSGTQFDPDVAALFCERAESLLEPLEEASNWDAVISAQPGLRRELSGAGLDASLEAIADFADLKSPYTLGHSRAVADLAAAAARARGMSDVEVRTVRRAGLVHDLGRLGISNSIWDKPGALTDAERERVRLHVYLTERILCASPGLAELGTLAAQHHERIDGSGYPHGLRGGALSQSARILAACDVYRAMVEPRPHRGPLSTAQAAEELRAEARAGRLDGTCVEAVLGAAGHAIERGNERPAGLTPREVEVLGLLARGLLNKQIARRLGIKPKTVGNHVERIYMKIEVSNRAAASLFATEHGLLAANGDGAGDAPARAQDAPPATANARR